MSSVASLGRICPEQKKLRSNFETSWVENKDQQLNIPVTTLGSHEEMLATLRTTHVASLLPREVGVVGGRWWW